MIISVTQEDIDHGISGDPERCPIALALKKALPAGWTVIIGSGYYARIRIRDSSNWRYMTFLPPLSVMEFTGRFDRLLNVSPFTFEIPDWGWEHLESCVYNEWWVK